MKLWFKKKDQLGLSSFKKCKIAFCLYTSQIQAH
jgi:hypothetical protein